MIIVKYIDRQNFYLKTLEGKSYHPILIMSNIDNLAKAKTIYKKVKSDLLNYIEK